MLQTKPTQAVNYSMYWLMGTLLLAFSGLWWGGGHPLVIVGACLLPIGIISVFRFPFVMVLGFVLFSFFRLHEAFPQLYSLRIPQMLALASLSALFWHLVVTRKLQIYWLDEMNWLIAFFILCFIGVFLASNRPTALAYFNGVYSKIALMTFAIAWLIREPQQMLRAGIAFVLAGCAIAGVALNNAAQGLEMVEGSRVTIGRSFGSTLGDPNDLALVLMFPLGFAAAFAIHPGHQLRKLLGFVGGGMLILAILATQSRGGLLGILTVVAVFGWNRVQNKALALTVLAVIAPILFLLAGVSERASGGSSESGVDESAMGRIYAWEAAFRMALTHPLSGVGLDNFYANYYAYSSHWDGKNHAVHSTWFGVLAETGFIGLLIFVVLLTKVIQRAIHCVKLLMQQQHSEARQVLVIAEAVLAGLCATAVSGTFLTQGFTWPIYIFIALVMAISRWLDSQS